MKIFYDTEFIDDGYTIDLISIGMVREDGKSFYAISKEFSAERLFQHPWLVENVLPSLPVLKVDGSKPWTLENYAGAPEGGKPWLWRYQIRNAVLEFCNEDGPPEFWGDYAAYDHVALAQLFGDMTAWPAGWPMYTQDVQMLADLFYLPKECVPVQPAGEQHHALYDARYTREFYLACWDYMNKHGLEKTLDEWFMNSAPE